MNPTVTPDGGSRSLKFHSFLLEFSRGYLERFGSSMPGRLRQVLHRILRCRTPALGGQVFRCPQCGDFHYQYHSCNDRHCPQCGQADADAWLAAQKQRLLLPVPYFLVTFTVPQPLRHWIRSNLPLGLDVLFRTSAQALQDLALNPRRLGAQLGMLGVLHTWARTLIFHPHIHFLVPGGGLSPEGRRWIPTQNHYLFKVEVLGAHFRTLFRRHLTQHHPQLLAHIPPNVWKQSWVVHSQPAGSGENALTYLSRYIFKTATANRSVQLLPNGKVRWPYRHSRTGCWTCVDLDPHQLIARILQHVLPRGYCRVRTFGWLHPAAKLRANRVRALLKLQPILSPQEIQTWSPSAVASLPSQQTTGQPPPAHDEPPPNPSPPPLVPSLPICPRCHLPMNLLASWRAGQPLPHLPKPRPP